MQPEQKNRMIFNFAYELGMALHQKFLICSPSEKKLVRKTPVALSFYPLLPMFVLK
jgi:hypothetical protein